MLNTYPCNPFPISSEQLHNGDNEELQAQIDAIKDGTAIDSFGDVETALTTKADNDVIAPEFDAEAGTYEIGDLVMYEGKLYEFTSAHETAGEWDSTEVTEKTVADEIDTVKSGLTNLIKSETVTLTTGINGHATTTIPDTVKVLHVTSNGAPCLAFTYNGYWFFCVLTWDASTLQLSLKPSAETTFTYYYV